jgi:imidazolonepropionase-like amidohydrolase
MRTLLATLLGLTALAGSASAQTTVIHADRVIADPSKPVLGATTLVVDKGRIVSMAPGLQPAPAGATLIDLRGKTVLPGLIDSHVHLASDPGTPWWASAVVTDAYLVTVGTKNAGITVRAGFTTVRDLGSPPTVGHALRDAIRNGVINGPRVLSSGPAISIIGGHGDVSRFRPDVVVALSVGNTCTGPIECAARVREASRAGADIIKITATGGVLSQQNRGLDQHFSVDEMRSIVTTAHSLGLKVAAHAHGPRGMEAAARAGVDSIEHGTLGDMDSVKAMQASGTVMVPTLMPRQYYSEILGKGVLSPGQEAKARETLATWGQTLRWAKQLGVKVAFGTDAGVFQHGRNGEEFQLMVDKGGFTPREALVSATTSAAALLGLEAEIGTLAPGKAADIIAVDGDPLADARALRTMTFVMAGGRVVPLN